MTRNVAIALGLVAGLTFGLIARGTGVPALLAAAQGVEPLGTAFVRLISVVVVPLVVTTLFTGIAGLGDLRRLGRVGGLSLLFYWGTTVAAILIGMAAAGLALPFAGAAGALTATGAASAEPLPGFADFLLQLVPANAVAAAADGRLLPLMVFVVLFGAAAGTLDERDRQRLVDLADTLTRVLVRLVHWVLWTAPVGVFALAAPVTAELGLDMLRSFAVFIVAVIAGLIVFFFGVYVPLVRWLGGVPARRFLRANALTAPIAFSTTSSAATLPAIFDAADDMGVSRPVTSLVVPLGVSINRSGSALYQGCAIIFLAHLYGTPIAAGALGAAVLATFLVALTIAAVPSASVMTLPPALATLGVPLDGIGVLLGIDRIPDMFRTVVNVGGDVAATAVVQGRTGT